jgi:hypothetical protein
MLWRGDVIFRSKKKKKHTLFGPACESGLDIHTTPRRSVLEDF